MPLFHGKQTNKWYHVFEGLRKKTSALNRKIVLKALPSKFGEFALQEREPMAKTSAQDHRRQEMGKLSKLPLKYQTWHTLR